MSMRWDSQVLLPPISVEAPCGENLEDTPLLAGFDALRLFGESRSPEAVPEPGENRKPPEWAEIKTNALDALSKSKDFRLLACLGVALLRTDGLPAFFQTLKVASVWLESYWDQVYPLLDDDAVARRNALNCFADPMAVVERVRRLPLVESRQHGSFSLRDLELAAGHVPLSAGDVKPGEGQIAAAFTEMPLEGLTALQRDVAGAMTALNSVDARMRNEGGPEMAPSFDPLSAQLVKMNGVLRARLDSRRNGAAADVSSTAGPAKAGSVAVGGISSRQDAIRVLEAVADFFRANEPSSPIPLLVDRARRLVAKDFLEVLADVAPDAVSQARAAGGLKQAE